MFPLPINCDFQLFHRLMMIPLKTQPDKSWKEMVLYAILFPSHMGMTWPQSLNWILLHWREQTHWYQGDQSAKMLLSWWIHIYLFIYFRLLCFSGLSDRGTSSCILYVTSILFLLSGFVLGSAEFNSSAALCK